MNAAPPSAKLYFLVWGALLLLLSLTWFVARLDFGRWNVVAGLSIAVLKTFLVVSFFMHARESAKITWVFAAAGVFWLLLMMTLTLTDYLSRGGFHF